MGWRCIVVALWLSGMAAGCAQFPPGGTDGTGGGGHGATGGDDGPSAFDPQAVSKTLHVGCAVDLSQTWAPLAWDLTVDPGPIQAGELFSASIDGVATFDEGFADAGNQIIPGGAREVNLLDMQVSVMAHAGASGPVVVLVNEPIPYHCALENPPGIRPSCDPSNDLPGIPGKVGNTDCQPVDDSNPCGRFIAIPTSDDCSPSGTCWNLGRDEPNAICGEEDFCKDQKKTECQDNGFCVTGDVRVPLQATVAQYKADSAGEVRFGWYGHQETPWEVPLPVFQDPLAPSGFRIRVGGIPTAFRCELGELDEMGLFAPVPEEKLVNFEIRDDQCSDGSRVCPEGFANGNNGLCVFTLTEPPQTNRDPMGSAASCEDRVFKQSLRSDLPTTESSIVSSPSLIIRTSVAAADVVPEVCTHDSKILGEVHYLGELGEWLATSWIVLNDKSSTTVSWSGRGTRAAEIVFRTNVQWSSAPDLCCERTFQTTWTATVAQCEGW